MSISNQDRTLDHYQELMTINATSHLLRAARQIGLFDQLASGQKTLPTLAANLEIPETSAAMLIRCLIAIGVVEQYEEDFALSSTARLLCQYDADLGDATWDQLVETLRSPPVVAPEKSGVTFGEEIEGSTGEQLRQRFDAVAATQWVHTPAAMQAAEILNLGPGETAADASPVPASEPISLLDLGCNSAVWSCAMAFREPAITITAVDSQAALVAATATATSIGLTDRFQTAVGDVLGYSIDAGAYDMIVIAQRLHSFSPDQIRHILETSIAGLRSGGRLVVIDSFRGPHRPTLSESLEVLRVKIQTSHGGVPDLAVAETRMKDVGFTNVQFTYIAASRIGLGMMIGIKP